MGGYKREIHKKHYAKQLRLIYLIFSLNFQIVETQIKFMSIFFTSFWIFIMKILL